MSGRLSATVRATIAAMGTRGAHRDARVVFPILKTKIRIVVPDYFLCVSPFQPSLVVIVINLHGFVVVDFLGSGFLGCGGSCARSAAVGALSPDTNRASTRVNTIYTTKRRLNLSKPEAMPIQTKTP